MKIWIIKLIKKCDKRFRNNLLFGNIKIKKIKAMKIAL